MKRLFLLIAIGFMASCQKDTNEPVIRETLEVYNIVFEAEDNPSLSTDLKLTFDGDHTFFGTAPRGATMKSLVSTIGVNAGDVEFEMNGMPYVSGSTEGDFSTPVTLTVQYPDGDGKVTYDIRLRYDNGIPVVYVDTNDLPIDSKEDYVVGNIAVYGQLDYPHMEETLMKIKGRGNSTWWQGVEFGKKPYQVKFSESTEMLGIPADRKWVFLAEWSDKSLMRNKITYEMGAMSTLGYTPKGEFVDLFVNDDYQGTYLMAQKVEVTPNRVNIGQNGYLVEIDQLERLDPEDVYFTPEIFTSHFANNVFNIKSPEIAQGSAAYNAISNHINEFESALFGSNFKDPDTGYRAYIDVPSFVDWYLINEISKTTDAQFWSSIYFTWVPGEKIKMGPLWDFDLSYGNVEYTDARYTEGYWIKDNLWFSRLFEDPYFANAVKERFQYYKNNMGYLLGKIDAYANYIDASQTDNYELWGTLGNYVWPNPVWFDTYEEEVDHLKNWLTTRMNWLDSEFSK
ncbi:CotH kinase family protein [Robertkochia sediminum]|uniref:CotH kinase family protein n=1 Tax=Robertkochia sediminum TaxID=2785326 RepID=UPI00193233F5|nr:CotH kinase family protein [Robertkochia sediminum]MBL7472932.1 CotH kinase family protein [Robertkochia sediminum]